MLGSRDTYWGWSTTYLADASMQSTHTAHVSDTTVLAGPSILYTEIRRCRTDKPEWRPNVNLDWVSGLWQRETGKVVTNLHNNVKRFIVHCMQHFVKSKSGCPVEFQCRHASMTRKMPTIVDDMVDFSKVSVF